jgi:hypothetical protein
MAGEGVAVAARLGVGFAFDAGVDPPHAARRLAASRMQASRGLTFSSLD